jgi:hypothetical protein
MGEAEMTADMVRFQYHSLVREAVDEIAPSHLNQKGRWGWVARQLGIGFDRARKAYQAKIRRVDHHEFINLHDRFVALIQKQDVALAQRRVRNEKLIAEWQESRASRVGPNLSAD